MRGLFQEIKNSSSTGRETAIAKIYGLFASGYLGSTSFAKNRDSSELGARKRLTRN